MDRNTAHICVSCMQAKFWSTTSASVYSNLIVKVRKPRRRK